MTYRNDPPNNCIQSDYTSSCRLNLNGSAQEQTFIENLIVESIELYGQDIYYLPRIYINRDTILNEVESSKFEQALAVRAYVNNVEGWEGQGELLSKFGVRIEDKTTFVFSRKKFEEKVDDNAVLNVEGRPNEGDLIWFPATKHLFEIKFVEAERPFYQLGKGYVWECQCELFEYSDEQIDTGVAEIDAVETTFANAIKLIMDAGGTGAFTVGEEVVGDLYLAKATATLSGDEVDIIEVIDGGEYYNTTLVPSVTIEGGGGNGATATATVSSAGIVTGINVTSRGTGYTSAPTVTIDYSPKDNRAEVKSWNASTRELQVINRTGTFNTAEVITGLSSGAKWSPESYNTLNNTNTADTIDQNYSFETEDDDIIDFTEGNPFGSIGSTTDTTI
ncbi:neck protein [Synechococcus phage S-RIM8]|uniref:Neck protein n=2 Tax=Neptunevirus srim18 TaxID=2734121 RepID=A0A1D7SBV4_9CAUD|nr:head closure Hc2 [Synechococcus phage S-RIM8 A.HR1]YP_009783003.1 head closure Hc2 [Synechococcus phage S-RIM8]AFB15370.1 neck protein [Synechococcus phage S-RIM8 A.HR5]AFB17796.1 gp14 neck protein [Synechococcus phage S-RIM8 A.HR3]AGH57952.1 neck protein [Synechococcus phage KBS-M-1A]AFB17585.1 gp14 neck protein [Synechococcus phage S-RIM8 A.HR1]AOO10242.1 neck protein [Synechococcus phage S-RIM8]